MPVEAAWVTLYGTGGRLHGVLAVNQPKKLMQYRKLLMGGAVTWDAALVRARELESA